MFTNITRMSIEANQLFNFEGWKPLVLTHDNWNPIIQFNSDYAAGYFSSELNICKHSVEAGRITHPAGIEPVSSEQCNNLGMSVRGAL